MPFYWEPLLSIWPNLDVYEAVMVPAAANSVWKDSLGGAASATTTTRNFTFTHVDAKSLLAIQETHQGLADASFTISDISKGLPDKNKARAEFDLVIVRMVSFIEPSKMLD